MIGRVAAVSAATLGFMVATVAPSATATSPVPPSAVALRMETTAKAVPVGIPAELAAIPINAKGAFAGGNVATIAWSVTPVSNTQLFPKRGGGTQFLAERPGRYDIRARLGRLTGEIAIRVVAAAKPGVIPTTTLILAQPSPHNKQLINMVGRVNVPKGMPPDAAVVRVPVPLYPGAERKLMRVHNYPAPVPSSYYLLASPVRGYYVHAPQTQVDLWYLNAFKAMGYSMNGQGGGPTNINTYDFTKDASAAEPETMAIRTESADGGTEVVYGGTDVVVPPRPRSSMMPFTVRTLTLTYRARPTAQPMPLDVTRSADVREVVHDLNAMPLSSGGSSFGCPSEGGPSVRIRLTSRAGHVFTAHLFDYSCQPSTIGPVQVSSSPGFWRLIEKLVRSKGA